MVYSLSYSFPSFEPVVPCLIVTVASWLTYRFLRRQVRWSGIPISLRIFPFVGIHTVKGISLVNEAELNVFLELLCFLHDSVNIDNLISCSPASLKPSLNIWNFSDHVLPSWTTALSWWRGLHNSVKLWAMLCKATQDGQVMVRVLTKHGLLEEEMATHSSILARKIPWTEEPCGL